jgi:CheY-like chemotaxis protein
VASCLNDASLRLIAQGQVHVAIEATPEPLPVRAAESQLARALLNLVQNAVEASGGAGQVTVRTFAARLPQPVAGYELIEPGDYVAISVSDNGAGITTPDLAHIFEPFFSKKRAGETSGTGLGLAITHAVVKEHNGFVDVVTTLGAGTTFTLYFPRIDDAVRMSERPVLRRGRARVLLVDDELVQLRTGRRVLTHLGYMVDTLSCGREAYQRFVQAAPSQESPYDIVLLDMLLNAEHDGMHVLEQIRGLFPAQKAILVSGHAPPDRARLAAEKGLSWLAKPYTLEALGSAVESALADGARRSTSAPARAAQSSPAPGR